MDRVRKRIHLDEVTESRWQRSSVTIAVLDSGICRHPDLEGKCLAFKDFVNGRSTIYDDCGHGTHVCGILCGSGELSQGKYRGIIPGARLVVGKVLNENGEGMADTMLEGLEWIWKNYKRLDIRLLNISVGIGSLKSKQKHLKLKEMLEKLWDAGVIVVCAAGNKGPADNSISAIGGSDKVITVGCYDDVCDVEEGENCALYSGRGSLNSTFRKPDLVAPGTGLVSCCHKVNWTKKGYEDAYMTQSGTSMSAPIVTGCAALLLQREPYLRNEQVKERLHYSSEDLGLAWNMQGWGMLHAKRLLDY